MLTYQEASTQAYMHLLPEEQCLGSECALILCQVQQALHKCRWPSERVIEPDPSHDSMLLEIMLGRVICLPTSYGIHQGPARCQAAERLCLSRFKGQEPAGLWGGQGLPAAARMAQNMQ